MSVDKWAYNPMTRDGEPCPGDCDFCSIAEKRAIGREFLALKENLATRLARCYVDEYTGELHIYDRTLDAVIDFFNFFTTTGGHRK